MKEGKEITGLGLVLAFVPFSSSLLVRVSWRLQVFLAIPGSPILPILSSHWVDLLPVMFLQ